MARGTRERFRQWEERVPSVKEAAKGTVHFMGANSKKVCRICRRPVGEHGAFEIVRCGQESRRRVNEGSDADR